jgi:hypothetical protein
MTRKAAIVMASDWWEDIENLLMRECAVEEG